MEERLRRMEAAYLRMEESHHQIQSEYKVLLGKYEDLSRKITAAEGPTTTPARSARVRLAPFGGAGLNTPGAVRVSDPRSVLLEALEAEIEMLPGPSTTQTPRLDLNEIGAGAEGTGGRTSPRQQPPSWFGGASPDGGSSGEPAPSPGDRMSRRSRIGAGAEGTAGRVSPEQQPTEGPDLKPRRYASNVRFAEGLEFTSEDEEFRIQFHNQTQVDFRGFDNRDLGVLNDQFYIPRQRWYFTGDLTKKIGFYTVVNRSYGTFDILDAFISLNFSDKFRFRIGRMKTPYLYEYFSIAEGDSIAPERSLFAANLSGNRQIGAMFLGELFKGRFTYATGVYNGPRNSFGDFDSAKDLIGYFSARPFLESQQFEALKYFNIGGSFDVGYENNPTPQPTYFETANDQTGSNGATGVSPTFLHLNNNVTELGMRSQWGAHAVWFYKSFFLMAEYGGARDGYSFTNSHSLTPVNFDGYQVTASYFLTGEQLTRRVNVVKPRRDFNFDFLKGGSFSPGAVELYARYSALDIGRNIFTAGFADPNLWSNHVWTTDVGANWYLNFYLRIFLDWQHAEFGTPVSVAPNKFSSTTDLYWLRFQLFF